MDDDGLRQRMSEAAGDDTEPLIQTRTQPRRPLSLWESIKASLVLSLVGLLIFFGGIGLQFWNEVSFCFNNDMILWSRVFLEHAKFDVIH